MSSSTTRTSGPSDNTDQLLNICQIARSLRRVVKDIHHYPVTNELWLGILVGMLRKVADIKQSFTVKIARVQSTFYSVLKRLFTSVFSYCSAVFMDTNYHSNRIVSTRSNPSYFAGSVNRQYGSGIGSAVRIGLRSFVIPLAKNTGFRLQRIY